MRCCRHLYPGPSFLSSILISSPFLFLLLLCSVPFLFSRSFCGFLLDWIGCLMCCSAHFRLVFGFLVPRFEETAGREVLLSLASSARALVSTWLGKENSPNFQITSLPPSPARSFVLPLFARYLLFPNIAFDDLGKLFPRSPCFPSSRLTRRDACADGILMSSCQLCQCSSLVISHTRFRRFFWFLVGFFFSFPVLLFGFLISVDVRFVVGEM